MARTRKTDLSKIRYLDDNDNDNPSEGEERPDEEKSEDSSVDKDKSESEGEISPPAPQDQARTITQLMRVIQQQNAQMQASQNAMNQLQSEAALARQRDATVAQQQQLTDAQAKVANVLAARLAGGIYSYKNRNALSGNERGFHQAITGLGINVDTVEELFRQGLSEMENMSQLTTEKFKKNYL